MNLNWLLPYSDHIVYNSMFHTWEECCVILHSAQFLIRRKCSWRDGFDAVLFQSSAKREIQKMQALLQHWHIFALCFVSLPSQIHMSRSHRHTPTLHISRSLECICAPLVSACNLLSGVSARFITRFSGSVEMAFQLSGSVWYIRSFNVWCPVLKRVMPSVWNLLWFLKLCSELQP